MSKTISRNKNNSVEIQLIEQFESVDTSDFPDFHSYTKPFEMALWVLWVSKEKLGIKRLTAEQIASIIRETKEISIEARSITNSLNRAKDKIHTYTQDKEASFEIMRPGKDHLLSQLKGGAIQAFYFEPDRNYTSKRDLAKNILGDLQGELRIVDPYCGQRCLDILGDLKEHQIKFLTKVENLRNNQRSQFLRELHDFKIENSNIDFKNYPNNDLHDRYIISSDRLVIIGHSIKDLGSRESFAVVLSKDSSRNVVEALTAAFDRRWSQSIAL